MSSISTIDIIRQIVAEQLHVSPTTVKDTDALFSDLGLDCQDEIQIIGAIECEFDIIVENSARDRSSYTLSDMADEVDAIFLQKAA